MLRADSVHHRSTAPTLLIFVAAVVLGQVRVAALADDELNEIVVTAQRQTERIQDVPIAITAISASDLTDRGVRQAGDIVSSVPNMLLNSPYGPEAQPTFTLRGVTTQDFSENQSSPIAMYVDEVYKSVGAVQALQVYDLDRVEVLRGPQGTLYGKNATGGAVSFYSANPSLTSADGYITAGVGNFHDYSVRAAAGMPIIDDAFGARVAVMYEKRDGWVHSVVPGVEPLNGVDAFAGRATFLTKPVDGLTATLKLSVSRSGGTPYGAHAINNDPTVTYFDGTISWFDNGAKYAVHKDIRNDSVSLKLEWELAQHATLTSITGYDYGRWYEKSDDGGLPIEGRLDDPNTYFSSVNAFSQEIRIASRDSGALGWLAGLYYGRESVHATVQFHFFDRDTGSFVVPNGTRDGLTLHGFDEYNDFTQIKTSKAAFVNAHFDLTPTFTLRAGARVTRDDISVENFFALEGGLEAAPVGFAPDGGTTLWTQTIPYSLATTYTQYSTALAPQIGVNPTLTQNNNNVSIKAGADWKPVDGILAYLSFSQGYRGAAFNGQAFNAPAELNFASPEKLTAYELGLKSEWWNRRAEFNAAAFHYDYRNQQFLDAFVLPGGSGTLFHTVNAPKSRVDGAEFELRAKLVNDLVLSASLGLLHSKYVELNLHTVDLSGNRLIQAPAYNGSVAANWHFAHISSGDFSLLLDANFYGKQYFDAPNTERIAQAAYGVANGRVSFESSSKPRFAVGAWIKNITNREYLAYGLAQRDPAQGGLGFDYALVGEPRTFGLDLTYRY
jgi:iron complex outermembrane receptor protein